MKGKAAVTWTSPDIATVRAEGELDLSTAPQLREALLQVFSAGAPSQLVVDLRAVQFIDSTGLGVLVGAQRRLRNGGGTMAVLGNERIRRMFDQTGLTTLLGFESSPS